MDLHGVGLGIHSRCTPNPDKQMFTQNKLTTCNRNAGTAECKSERIYHGEDENVQAPQIDRQTQHHRTSWKCYTNRNLRSSFLSSNCLSVDHSLSRSFSIFSPATKYVVYITRKEKRRWSKAFPAAFEPWELKFWLHSRTMYKTLQFFLNLG
jgi:hypothetical protein